MAVTEIKLAIGVSPQSLQAEIDRLVAASYKPFPSAEIVSHGGFLALGMYKGSLEGALSGVEDRLDALEAESALAIAALEDVETWAGTLATKLNADATAQNALSEFPLTLDTNYAGVTLTLE